jgi:hypothetical protein
MVMDGRTKWLGRLTLTAMLAFGAPAVAGAAPPPTQFLEFRAPFTTPPETMTLSCGGGLTLTVVTTYSGVSSLRESRGVKDPFFHYSERYTETTTITTQSGERFTISGSGVFKEVAVRRVEGSDRLFVFDVLDAGSRTLRDADGSVLARDRGSTRETILFDTFGDDVPGGQFVDFPDYRENGQHTLLDPDVICTEIAEALAG